MYSARFGIGFWSPYAARYSPGVLRYDPESEPSSREIKVTPLLRLRFCNSLWRDPSEREEKHHNELQNRSRSNSLWIDHSEREEKHQQDDNDGDADNSEPDSSLKDVDDRVASGQGGQKQEEEDEDGSTMGHGFSRFVMTLCMKGPNSSKGPEEPPP